MHRMRVHSDHKSLSPTRLSSLLEMRGYYVWLNYFSINGYSFKYWPVPSGILYRIQAIVKNKFKVTLLAFYCRFVNSYT